MTGATDSRRGFLLPVAMLLVLAWSSTAIAALVLAGTEAVSERADHRHLLQRVLEAQWIPTQSVSGEFSAEGGGEGGGDEESPDGLPLRGGYLLVRAAAHGAAGPAPMSVYWRLDPDSAAYHLLPGGAEVGTIGGAVEGLREMTEEAGCPPPRDRPLLHTRSGTADLTVDPPLPEPPRLGPLGIRELLERAEGRISESGELFPSASAGPFLLSAPEGAVLSEGDGYGVLLGEGDLTLGQGFSIRGVVVTRGDLRMDAGSTVRGLVLVGGSLQMQPGSLVLGCPAIAAEVIGATPLSEPWPIPGGHRLGRF